MELICKNCKFKKDHTDYIFVGTGGWCTVGSVEVRKCPRCGYKIVLSDGEVPDMNQGAAEDAEDGGIKIC